MGFTRKRKFRRWPEGALAVLLALALPLLGTVGGCGEGNQSGDLAAEQHGDLSNPPAAHGDGYAEIAAACEVAAGGAVPPASGETQLRRRPYVQQVTDRSARLLWTAAATAESTAAISDPSGTVVAEVEAIPDESVAVRNGVAQYLAPIEGLQPGTVYCYEIRSGQAVWSRSGFRTAPAPGSGQPVRFVAFGDSGSGDADQRAMLDQMRTVPFDLLVHTGDLAYDDGTRAQFEANVFSVYADVFQAFPFYPASGNHEYNSEGAAPFREAFSLPENGGRDGRERWYSFDWGDVHFVALDTERIGPAQAAWLEADLAKNRLPWTVVYGHRPPLSSGEHGGDAGFQQHFVPVIERHGVQLVLSGHDHNYERTRTLNGVTYVVTGGGGKGTRPVGKSPFTAFSEAVIHFVYVEISGNTLILHAIDGQGQEFDSVRIDR
jgi:3',5'-cyclic AMP phosphodiesterase CpdA